MNRLACGLAVAASLAIASARTDAAPIVSGDGEGWTSVLADVCAQVSSGAPCSGTTVVVSEHPLWQDDSVTNPAAKWVSYGDTGYAGATLAPYHGQTAIMSIYESFVGVIGSQLSVRFWADDTVAVYLNGALMKAANFTQNTCADGPIGCEPKEYWDLDVALTQASNSLRIDAFQVGEDTTTTGNPFGVLYSGSYAAVPEPATLSLLGLGLATFVAARRRRS